MLRYGKHRRLDRDTPARFDMPGKQGLRGLSRPLPIPNQWERLEEAESSHQEEYDSVYRIHVQTFPVGLPWLPLLCHIGPQWASDDFRSQTRSDRQCAMPTLRWTRKSQHRIAARLHSYARDPYVVKNILVAGL